MIMQPPLPKNPLLELRAVYYTSHFNEVEMGVYWFYPVSLSVCSSVRLSVCLSVDRIIFTLYLQQYLSDPFQFCTSNQAISKGVLAVNFVSKFVSKFNRQTPQIL